MLDLVEEPAPDPGPGQVRVRIHRSGVNPTDWKSRRGAEPGVQVDPAQTPGQDGAGTVDAVGGGVEAALLGLRVWVWEAAFQNAYGTAAEYSVLPARLVVPLPDVASFDLGAALGVPFITAHRCLTVAEDGPLRLGPGTLQGRTVLIAGGAGAVGNAAIQLARWSDATVITTVSSPAKAQLAAAAGADHVIDYRETDVVAEVRKIAPKGVDVVAGGRAGAERRDRCRRPRDRRHGGDLRQQRGRRGHTAAIRPLMMPNARIQFVLLYTAPYAAKARAVEDVRAAVLDRAARVGDDVGLPLHHYPLAEAAAAHTGVEEGAVGKVLLDVLD